MSVRSHDLSLGTRQAGPEAAGKPAGAVLALKLYRSEAGYHAITAWYEDTLASIEIPVESAFVGTRFGRTHFLACGDRSAPALLLVPGVAGCAPLWRRQLPALSRHFRVIALDIPGQPGRSDPETPSFLNDEFSDWLRDVLDGLGIARAHVAGVSVGAWIAMRFAIAAPQRVVAVVMLGPTGLASARLPWRIWLTRVMKKSKDADALQDDLTARSVSSKSPGGSFGTFDRTLARAMALCTRHYRVDWSLGIYDETTRRVDIWKGLKVLRKFFFSESRKLLRQFAVPGLLVFGEHEVLYDPHRVAAKARRLMPGLETVVVAGAGHAAVYDRPDEVNELMIRFCRQAEGASR
ncbi:MAG: alpha/beta hydrolase [Gammaproteobacteria bacterium]|nr:alpha/beta hydrolase [Gammaproteobacteria bacterium]